MRTSKSRRRSNFNPFISLTDILFNLILLLIFASALFAQDINQKYAENRDFQNRLASLQLERDSLIDNVNNLTSDLDDAAELEAALRDNNTTLEEQIGILVSNLDSAQVRQQELLKQISVIVGDLNDAQSENDFLNERITVVLGDLDIAEDANTLLEEEITIIRGSLEDAEALTANLQDEVSELSRNNFLVVELEWLTEPHDLDLHIVDPNGNRFYWDQASYPEATSRLTLDNRIGARPNKPGLEIWTAREVELGTYQIQVGLWGCGRGEGSGGYQVCTTDSISSILLRHRDGDDLIANVTIAADNSYAQISGQEFSLNENLFNQLFTVAEVIVTEENGKIELEVQPSEGLSSVRLATNEQ